MPFTERTLQRGVYVVNTLQRRIFRSRNVRANVPPVAKSDRERGPVAAWMRRERRARKWTTADVVRELGKRGVHILEPSYRGYEAGPRPPSAQVRHALEAVFGSPAPDITKEAAEPQQLDGLIAAITAQTAAITRLADALAGPQEPMVPIAAVREVVRQIVASAPDLASLGISPNGPVAPNHSGGPPEDR